MATEQRSEFERGVQTSQKLWEGIIGQLLSEARLEISYLKCGKCGTRYRTPEGALPSLILCPQCRRYPDGAIGVCKATKTVVSVSSGEWERETNAAYKLLQAAKALIAKARTPGPTSSVEVGLPELYQRLENACTNYDERAASGWSHSVLTKLEESDLTIPESATAKLAHYDPSKDLECSVPVG